MGRFLQPQWRRPRIESFGSEEETTPAAAALEKMDEMIRGLGQKVVELGQDKWTKLAISVLIDIIGVMTFLIPVVRVAPPLRALAVGLYRQHRHRQSLSSARAGR